MLKYKILVANVIFCSLPHKDQIMKNFDKLNDIFKKYQIWRMEKIDSRYYGNRCMYLD